MTSDDFKDSLDYDIDYILKDKQQPYILREMRFIENNVMEPDILIPVAVKENYTQIIYCLVFRANEDKTYKYRGYLYANMRGENVKKVTLYPRNGKEIIFDPKKDNAFEFCAKVKMYLDNYDNFRSIDKL